MCTLPVSFNRDSELVRPHVATGIGTPLDVGPPQQRLLLCRQYTNFFFFNHLVSSGGFWVLSREYPPSPKEAIVLGIYVIPLSSVSPP